MTQALGAASLIYCVALLDRSSVSFTTAQEMLDSASLAQLLEHSDKFARQGTATALGHLEPAALAEHVPALLHCLEDPYRGVREAALAALDKLDPVVLALHGPAAPR